MNKHSVIAEKLPGKFSAVRKTAADYLTQPIVRLLAKTHTTPNTITWLGFLITLGAVVLIVFGHLFAAGFVVLAAGFFDLLDGALARQTNQTTPFGGILDSTLDRVSEAMLFLGILVFYTLNSGPRSTIVIPLASVAMIGSFLVSYIRARAEGAGLECRVGLLTRAERVGVLVLGLLLSQFDYVLIVALATIAVLSLITVSQRLVHIWHQSTKSDRL